MYDVCVCVCVYEYIPPETPSLPLPSSTGGEASAASCIVGSNIMTATPELAGRPPDMSSCIKLSESALFLSHLSLSLSLSPPPSPYLSLLISISLSFSHSSSQMTALCECANSN